MFKRAYRLKIGTKEITELRVRFEITKTLIGSPNLAKIEIYNLNETSRNQIKSEYEEVELYAGYKDNAPLIFKGQIRTVQHIFDRIEWITTLFCGDGALALETATINKTIPAGGTSSDMMDALLGELNTVGGIAKGQMEGLKKCVEGNRSILKSIVMSGSVKEMLDTLAKRCNFNYSINDGVLDTNAKGKPLIDEASFLISQKTGMIGSPELTEIGADVSVYLRGDLKLARRFTLDSKSASINIGNQYYRKIDKTTSGTYMIQQIKHIGDTHDNDWKTSLVGVVQNG